jgi:hypothetical protein
MFANGITGLIKGKVLKIKDALDLEEYQITALKNETHLYMLVLHEKISFHDFSKYSKDNCQIVNQDVDILNMINSGIETNIQSRLKELIQEKQVMVENIEEKNKKISFKLD